MHGRQRFVTSECPLQLVAGQPPLPGRQLVDPHEGGHGSGLRPHLPLMRAGWQGRAGQKERPPASTEQPVVEKRVPGAVG